MRTVAQLSSLKDRGVIITGGLGHLGLASADALSELGARIALLDIATALGGKGQERMPAGSVFIGCDLADVDSTRTAAREAVAKLGRLDVLVHCAAFVGTTKMQGWAVPFEDQSVEAWDAAIRVNLTAGFVLAQELKGELSKHKTGSIIFFSSIYGMLGPDMSLYEGTSMANPLAYGASKGGLLQLTRYLSTILAPAVRVNAISPGGVFRGQPESFVSRYENRTPLRRMATEEDIKGAVAFLASDLSAYVTGQNIPVDGGWTAW